MKELTITINQSITIQANCELVWDYTQDFNKRKLWDKSVIDLKILQLKPFKLIRIKTVGGIITTLKYKLCRKYEITTLKMENTKSLIIKGGGGSWRYEKDNLGTKWTQINSLTFKNIFLYKLFGKFLRQELLKNTIDSMHKVKEQIENL